jgi:hypothetical protein
MDRSPSVSPSKPPPQVARPHFRTQSPLTHSADIQSKIRLPKFGLAATPLLANGLGEHDLSGSAGAEPDRKTCQESCRIGSKGNESLHPVASTVVLFVLDDLAVAAGSSFSRAREAVALDTTVEGVVVLVAFAEKKRSRKSLRR